MKKHLVLVGGGHAHMIAMTNIPRFLEKGHKVTLVSSSPYHYYSGMGPGMLAGTYRPEEVRFHVKKLVEDRGASFIGSEVVGIEQDERLLHLQNGDRVSYDVVSFNVGSFVPNPWKTAADDAVFPVKPIVRLLDAREKIFQLLKEKSPKIVVAGGGPAGLEISGNVWRLVHEASGRAEITLLAGRRFLPKPPEKVRKLARKSLNSRGIEIVEGSYVSRVGDGAAVLDDGRDFAYDVCFAAMGAKPSPLFADCGLPTHPDGGLLVNDRLQSVEYPEIFGGGDCISFKDNPVDKVGVYALRQNPVLFHNLMAALEGGDMKSFEAKGAYLLIFNMGDGRGIFRKKWFVWEGKIVFRLKDYIDTKFMRKFQVSGELETN